MTTDELDFIGREAVRTRFDENGPHLTTDRMVRIAAFAGENDGLTFDGSSEGDMKDELLISIRFDVLMARSISVAFPQIRQTDLCFVLATVPGFDAVLPWMGGRGIEANNSVAVDSGEEEVESSFQLLLLFGRAAARTAVRTVVRHFERWGEGREKSGNASCFRPSSRTRNKGGCSLRLYSCSRPPRYRAYGRRSTSTQRARFPLRD